MAWPSYTLRYIRENKRASYASLHSPVTKPHPLKTPREMTSSSWGLGSAQTMHSSFYYPIRTRNKSVQYQFNRTLRSYLFTTFGRPQEYLKSSIMCTADSLNKRLFQSTLPPHSCADQCTAVQAGRMRHSDSFWGFFFFLRQRWDQAERFTGLLYQCRTDRMS